MTKKRYSIMVLEKGSDHEVELCQCDTNPKPIAEAAAKKTYSRKRLGRYVAVRVVDNHGTAP